MNMDSTYVSRHSTVRSSDGCWTCRLRRKKCDEKRPVCDVCAALLITCHYSQEKPEWMDGSVRQEEMAERLKRQVKEQAQRQRGERPIRIPGSHVSPAEAAAGEWVVLPQTPSGIQAASVCDRLRIASGVGNDGTEACPQASTAQPRSDADCAHTGKEVRGTMALGRSDIILTTFYLEHLFPFLFPFYRPSLLQGGRAWILEMMLSSPVVRQATLCQSTYFFSLARGAADRDQIWDTMLTQTRDAFVVLRQALQVINGSGIAEHLHGAVRIMTGIMQVQRFEIAVLSFENCRTHLGAALDLFQQLLISPGVVEPAEANSNFNAVMCSLGPRPWNLPTDRNQVPSSEQAAFRFSSALLILDDIIASTVFQEQPRLYEYHKSLLGNIGDSEPAINLDSTIGCHNWALLQIAEIAVLDAWKQRCKTARTLDMIELVQRATPIKTLLETHLIRLETGPASISAGGSNLLDVFTAYDYEKSGLAAGQSGWATRIWAHAAFIYLFVVVSGWQPASAEVRYHVGQILELLTHRTSPPALLRAMVWPLCVAGCLAGSEQEAQLRGIVEALQPPSVFGTVRKAFEIMENVWSYRNAGDVASRDLAWCFRASGDLILLV